MRICLTICLTGWLLAFPCFQQAQTAPAPAESQPSAASDAQQRCSQEQSTQEQSALKIRKTTRLVEVQVVARDKNGNAVRNLQAKDFVVLDNGRPQKIASFTALEGTAPPQAFPQPQPSVPGKTKLFSNAHPENESAVVFLLDFLNTPLTDQANAKQQLLRSLQQINETGPIALLYLGDGLRLLSDFGSSPASVAETLTQFKTTRQEGHGPALFIPDTGKQKLDEKITQLDAKIFPAIHQERLAQTLDALSLIRRHLAGIRGRKSLVWISGGVLVYPPDQDRLQKALDAFNDANVSVYAINSRGLFVDSELDPIFKNGDVDLVGEVEDQKNGDVLAHAAHDTGGLYYRNQNGLDIAVKQAMEDPRWVYTLSYYPDHDAWDGKFHRIGIRTSLPGIQLRHRDGYFANPESQPAAQLQETQLREIADSPLDFSGIRFSANFSKAAGDPAAHLTLYVTANDLELAPQENKRHGLLQLWCLQRSATGTELKVTPKDFTVLIHEDAYPAVVRDGLRLKATVPLQPAATKVRVVLRDTLSGRIGTLDIPLSPATPSQKSLH